MATKLSTSLRIDQAPCGHQLWWGRDTYGNQFGCGVMAAIDGLIYSRVVGTRDLERKTYMALAEAMWYKMRPNTGLFFHDPKDSYKGGKGIGVYSISKFKSGLKNYCKAMGIQVDFSQFSNLQLPWQGPSHGDVRAAISFIEKALMNDQALHLLSWYDRIEAYSFHWITIVGVEKKGSKTEVTIRTWGDESVIKDFKAFWEPDHIGDNKWMITYTTKKV